MEANTVTAVGLNDVMGVTATTGGPTMEKSILSGANVTKIILATGNPAALRGSAKTFTMMFIAFNGKDTSISRSAPPTYQSTETCTLRSRS